jgi:hypothetical protein
VLLIVLALAGCALPQRPDPQLPGRHWLEKAQPPMAQGMRDRPALIQTDRALGFDDCVFLAMQQAPGLVSGAIELEIAGLRKENAYWKQYPEVHLVTGVTTHLNRHDDSDGDGSAGAEFWVGFTVNGFNPVAGHFSYEASCILQDIAVLTHQKAIEAVAEQIGEILLRLDFLSSVRRKQEALPGLARDAAAYWRTAVPGPEYDSIEQARAVQKQKQAQAILDKTDAEIEALRVNLKMLLGLDSAHALTLESSFPKLFDTRRMGYDRTDGSDWEPAWETNTETRISQLALNLQNFNILLAWSRYLPEAGGDIYSRNPTSGYTGNASDDDPYALLKLSIPLLDYGNRARGVEEARLQKTKTREALRQHRVNFAHRWAQAGQTVNLLKATLALAEENLGLSRIEARREDIEFRSGRASFAQSLEGLEKVIREEIRVEEAVFNLRRQQLGRHFLNGDFSRRFFGSPAAPKKDS